ncbi:MAG: GFA family protein [Woeseiaceae bacterium]
MPTLNGGCHCGSVRFEVQANADIAADQCNCSICRMSGYLHLLVEKDAFKIVSGKDALRCYQFNSGIAQHYFCGQCGIKSFYIPRSHPHGVSVNVNCLDEDDIDSVTVTPFDGENWEQNVHKLSLIND